jgi:hypothetical protein
MQILGNDQMRIDNKPVSLTDDQQQLLRAYSQQVRQTVPAVVDVALEGVELGLTTVSEVFYGLLDSEPPASLTNALSGIRARINEQVRREGNDVYLDAAGVSDMDDVMDTLAPEIEAAVSASLGELFSKLGSTLKDEDVSLTESIARLVHRMDNFSAELETSLQQHAKTLETKADGLCEQLEQLQLAENKFQAVIPAAMPFDLIEHKVAP